MKHLLFCTRIVLYFLLVSVPFIHPAIVITYDLAGIGMWFVCIPLVFLLAMYAAPPRIPFWAWISVILFTIVLIALVFGGFSSDAIFIILAGLAAAGLTIVIFHGNGRGRFIAALELVFAGAVYFAYLGFSRSSADIAKSSQGVVIYLLMAALVSLTVHAIVLFIASFPGVMKKRKRDLGILALIILPMILLAALLIPGSFITNELELNPLGNPAEPKTNPLDQEAESLDKDGRFEKWMREWLEGGGRRRDREGGLEGMSPDEWDRMDLSSGTGKGGRNSRQFAVMVVAGKQDPIYLAYKYLGKLDARRGFTLSVNDPLNVLNSIRLIETWENPDVAMDMARENKSVFVLSTLPERMSAYQPISVTPTIFRDETRPFSYSYETVSGFTTAGWNNLAAFGGLSDAEKQVFAPYLEIPFDPAMDAAFREYIRRTIPEGLSYFERLRVLLESYGSFQYELGYNENVDPARMLEFLYKTQTGDCTEFANASAMLARYLGIPARVVTGFLAAKDLQLPKHKRALLVLQDRIESLKQFDLDELFMVTTAHRHAWFQAYIPPFGWIDMEATQFAIPPVMGGNPNDWNLVIPMIQKENPKKIAEPFPWAMLGIGLAAFFAGLALLVYLYKYGRELFLKIRSASYSRHGIRALGRLLLAKLRNRGHDYKPVSATMIEYAEKYPVITGFAGIYTELSYRIAVPEEERIEKHRALRKEYKKILRQTGKMGMGRRILYVFSLRGIRY